jgi:putative ABC transport system permease protein
MFGSIRASASEIATAARLLLRRPAFSGLAAALFALGIGAVAAIFSVVNATMLRPLPYRAADRLVALNGTEPGGDTVNTVALGYFQFSRWRSTSRSFVALEGYTNSIMKFLGGDAPEPIDGALVSAGFFDALGWKPARGRGFTRAEELPQAGVVVISHALWMRRFSGDTAIVGKAINIDEEPRTIIGVMPNGFAMPFLHADAWMPIPLDAQTQARKARLIVAVGRLRDGATIEQARSELLGINKVLGEERPDEHRYTGVLIMPLRDALFGNQRATLLVLLGASGLLLAVATLNVLSLSLGDAVARRIATMTRIALGADRLQIVRLRFFELGVLATVGCVVGLLVARLGLTALSQLAPGVFGTVSSVAPDLIVGGAALLLALAVGVVAAAPAAVQEGNLRIASLAGSDVKSIGSAGDRRRRAGLLGAQVGLAVVLLIGAALLAKNVRSLLTQSTGFRSDGVSVVELTFSPNTYKTPTLRAEHARALLEAVRAVPGVSSAATIQTRFVLNETMQTLFEIEGRPAAPGDQPFVNIRHVTPEVGKVLGIRLIQGRLFTEDDREGTRPVAIASASFARQHWPDENPIGKRVRRVITQEAPWMEVVGVVDDIKDAGAGVDVGPVLFVSYLQQNTAMARPTIVVRANADPGTLFPALRRAIWSVDGNQTIDAVNRLDDLMLRSAAQPRLAAAVAGMLAVAAVMLLLGGIYAVTLHSVLRRTREIGVRAALGAGPTDLLWTTVRQSVLPVLVGCVAGALAAVPTFYWMRGVLVEGVTSRDVPVIAAVLGSVVIASAIAAVIPARRALSIPPGIAMRDAG